jgi:hypothetical protein
VKGRVYVEHRSTGFFAVQTEDNDFTVIEALGEPPSILKLQQGANNELNGNRSPRFVEKIDNGDNGFSSLTGSFLQKSVYLSEA